MEKTLNIVKLPPELIIEILSFCDGASVLQFAAAVYRQNENIWEMIRNEKQWKALIPPGDEFIKHLESHTTSLTIGNIQTLQWSLSESLIRSIQSSCTSLKEITIINCDMNTDNIKLSMFPKTLTHLKFVYVTMPNRVKPQTEASSVQDSPFYQVHEFLPNLQCIEVEGSSFYYSDIVAASIGSLSIRLLQNFEPNSNLEIDQMKYRVFVENDNEDSSQRIKNEHIKLITSAIHRLQEYVKVKKLDEYFIDQDFINRCFPPISRPFEPVWRMVHHE